MRKLGKFKLNFSKIIKTNCQMLGFKYDKLEREISKKTFYLFGYLAIRS